MDLSKWMSMMAVACSFGVVESRVNAAPVMDEDIPVIQTYVDEEGNIWDAESAPEYSLNQAKCKGYTSCPGGVRWSNQEDLPAGCKRVGVNCTGKCIICTGGGDPGTICVVDEYNECKVGSGYIITCGFEATFHCAHQLVIYKSK